MTAAAAFTRTWPVGRFHATLSTPAPTLGVLGPVVIEWAPRMPKGLTVDEFSQYHTGRNRALAELAEQFGIRVAVLDLP